MLLTTMLIYRLLRWLLANEIIRAREAQEKRFFIPCYAYIFAVTCFDKNKETIAKTHSLHNKNATLS